MSRIQVTISLLLIMGMSYSSLIGQSPRWHWGLEHNLMGWASGHAGPELGATRTKGKYQFYLGFKYAFYSPYSRAEAPIEILGYNTQRFSRGGELKFSYRRQLGKILQSGVSIKIGSYKYDCQQMICMDGYPVYDRWNEYAGIMRCTEFAVNDFTEKAIRVGISKEFNFTAYRSKSFSIHPGFSFNLNYVKTTYPSKENHIHPKGREITSNTTYPYQQGALTNFIFENIPSKSSPGAHYPDDRVNLSLLLILQLRYTFTTNQK